MKPLFAMQTKISNIVSVLVIVVGLTGCRTYGDHGSEQASFDQIVSMNAQFKQDLERARGELSELQQAAGRDNDLSAAVEQYESLLAMHNEMIEEHEALHTALKVKSGALGRLSTSYRNLNRALGYVAGEQAKMKNAYANFADALVEDMRLNEVEAEMSRYQIAPPYYERIRFALANQSVSEALESRAGS